MRPTVLQMALSKLRSALHLAAYYDEVHDDIDFSSVIYDLTYCQERLLNADYDAFEARNRDYIERLDNINIIGTPYKSGYHYPAVLTVSLGLPFDASYADVRDAVGKEPRYTPSIAASVAGRTRLVDTLDVQSAVAEWSDDCRYAKRKLEHRFRIENALRDAAEAGHYTYFLTNTVAPETCILDGQLVDRVTFMNDPRVWKDYYNHLRYTILGDRGYTRKQIRSGAVSYSDFFTYYCVKEMGKNGDHPHLHTILITSHPLRGTTVDPSLICPTHRIQRHRSRMGAWPHAGYSSSISW